MRRGLGQSRAHDARAKKLGRASHELAAEQFAAAQSLRDDDVARNFDDLFATEYSSMVRLATLMVDSVAIAEELVQDAFVKLHTKWGGVESPVPYLRTTVMNNCRNELRSRTRERKSRRLLREEIVELEADEMLDAVRKLSERQRAAIVLRFYEDLSEADIARTLGVAPGTVKSLLHRATTELRRTLN